MEGKLVEQPGPWQVFPLSGPNPHPAAPSQYLMLFHKHFVFSKGGLYDLISAFPFTRGVWYDTEAGPCPCLPLLFLPTVSVSFSP